MEESQGCRFNTPHVHAKVSNRAPLTEVTIEPQLWHSKWSLVSGQRRFQVKAPPRTAFTALCDCFNRKLAAEVDTQAWALHIMAFVDYEAVRLKAEVFRNPNSETRSEVRLHDILQDDAVQFSRVCSIVFDHLSTSNLQVLEPGATHHRLRLQMDGGFYDDPFELEEDLPVVLASLLEAAGSPMRSLREQSLQALARWAEHRRDCLPAMADALLQHRELVGQLLMAPLAECYPLAVALKIASGCPRDAEQFARQILPLIPWPKAGLPSLMSRELEEIFWKLTKAAVVNTGVGEADDRLEEPTKVVANEFSRASTCEASITSGNEFHESEEVTVDLLLEDENL